MFFVFVFVFANKHSFLNGRNEPLVRYCFLWLLYGRGERFVRFLMAELCRRRVPSMMYVMGVVVLTSYALPFVGCCTIYHLLCVSIYEKNSPALEYQNPFVAPLFG